MNNAERRPPSTFYADVNDPVFSEDFFDAYYAPIERYVEEHAANTQTEAWYYPEQLARRISAATREYMGMDHIIHYTNETLSTYEVIDHGMGLARAIVRKVPTDPDHPTILQGSGIELDTFIAQLYDKHMDRAYLLNAAGVALGEPGRAIMWDWLRPDLERGDAAWNLFGVKMAMVTIAELTFDESGKPVTPPARSAKLHQQFGVVTTEGFAPFFTRLADSHPVMQAYNNRIYEEGAAQRFQARLHEQVQRSEQVTQQPSSFLVGMKAVAKRLLLRYNK